MESLARRLVERKIPPRHGGAACWHRIKTAEELGWSEGWSRYNTERTWQVLDQLFAVAEAVGKQPAQVALRWVLQRPGVTAPIIGARTLEQLEANVGSTSWVLDAEWMACLDQVSQPELTYPYNFITTTRR